MNSNHDAYDEALLEQILESLAAAEADSGTISDADLEADFYHEGFLPSTAQDEMLGQLLLEGPGRYLGLIVQGLNERSDTLIEQLHAMERDEDRHTAFSRLGDVLVARYWILRLFLRGFPQPPFAIIGDLLPVKYEVVVYRWWRPQESQIQRYLCDLILELTVVEEYLITPDAALPENPLLRFVVGMFQAARKRRFIRAIRRVTVAAENLRGYLITYLEPYLLNLHFQQEYQDYAD